MYRHDRTQTNIATVTVIPSCQSIHSTVSTVDIWLDQSDSATFDVWEVCILHSDNARDYHFCLKYVDFTDVRRR